MILKKEVDRLNQTVDKIPKIVNDYYVLTRRHPLEVRVTEQLKKWEDNIITSQEQLALNGLITNANVTDVDNTATAAGKIEGYYKVTNKDMHLRKMGAFWTARTQFLSSLSPLAAIPFRETIGKLVDHNIGTSPTIDIASTAIVIALGLTSFAYLQFESAINRQKGRLLEGHERIFHAQKKLAVQQVNNEPTREKSTWGLGFFQKNRAELAVTVAAARDDLRRMVRVNRPSNKS